LKIFNFSSQTQLLDTLQGIQMKVSTAICANKLHLLVTVEADEAAGGVALAKHTKWN